PIQGAPERQLTALAMNPDCNQLAPLPAPCAGDGAGVSDQGDASITTDCPGVTWTSNNPGGGTSPNIVVFKATPTLDIPANSPVLPGFCSITFNVQLVALSPEGSVIPELVGYASALCDNGILDSGGFQTADIITARQFGCYEVPRVKIPAPQPVKLQDRFGTTTSKPVHLRELCAPADKNGSEPT